MSMPLESFKFSSLFEKTILHTTNHSFRSKYADQHFQNSMGIWNLVLFESRSFIAVPSIGALVPGWLLIVPKNEALCVGALDDERHEELMIFAAQVMRKQEECFGPIAMFEHGPAMKSSCVGCGVDFAHLHLVPVKYDLHSGAVRAAPTLKWGPAKGFEVLSGLHKKGISYLYLWQPDIYSNPIVGTGSSIPSQLFRRVIAGYMGDPSKFDWKTNPHIENIQNTIDVLTSQDIGYNSKAL